MDVEDVVVVVVVVELVVVVVVLVLVVVVLVAPCMASTRPSQLFPCALPHVTAWFVTAEDRMP